MRLGNVSGTAVAISICRKSWFASPFFCIREPVPANTHPSKVRHGARLNASLSQAPCHHLSLTTFNHLNVYLTRQGALFSTE